jgi:hypothetical protein
VWSPQDSAATFRGSTEPRGSPFAQFFCVPQEPRLRLNIVNMVHLHGSRDQLG